MSLHSREQKKKRETWNCTFSKRTSSGWIDNIIQENNSQSRRGFYMGIDNRITLQSKVVAAAEADDE